MSRVELQRSRPGGTPKPASCVGCPLESAGVGFVGADGGGTNGILIVGEAPGETEAREGRPFIGQSGLLLDRILKRAGLERAGFRVGNTIACRPPKNMLAGMPYEHRAISHCAGNLDREIAAFKPKVILALGNTALRRLTGMSGILRLRGWPLPGVGAAAGSWVVGTLHPSYLLPRHGQKDTAKLTGLVILDIKKAVKIATEGFQRDSGMRYLEDPPVGTAAMWVKDFQQAVKRDPETVLSWDLETPGKLIEPDEEELEGLLDPTILRIGFSYRPGMAMSIPWDGPYLPIIRELLASSVPHVVWNGNAFDVPLVRAHGIIPGGPVWDAMWAWHYLQSDLPRGLEKVASVFADTIGPWKHRAAEVPAWYNACDADVALRCMLGIKAELQARKQWDVFLAHSVELEKVLFTAGRVRGVHIDRTAQSRLAAELEAAERELLLKAQEITPATLWNRKLSAKPIPGAEEIRVPGKVRVCGACGLTNPPVGHTRVLKKKVNPCAGAEVQRMDGLIPRWVIRPDFPGIADLRELRKKIGESGFNPLSGKQLEAYVRKFKHPMGRHAKTGEDTLDKLAIEKLAKKFGADHPIYRLTMELREVRKTLGTYVEGYTPDRLGRVYTTYLQAPSTLRLASREVNLQNVTHRSGNRWADSIRRTIIPPPGHVFVEADSTAIEAVFSGWFMGDPQYIALAKQGIHAYVCCQKLGWAFTPETVKAVKTGHSELYERTKRVVHGTNYGMTPRLMVQIYPQAFPNLRVATEAQEDYFKACPRLAEWQHEVRLRAHREGVLINPWGYRHYFWDVFTKDPKGGVKLGVDGKRVVAFLPQSSAAAFMKDTLLALGRSRWEPFLGANCSVHDSVCLAVPQELEAEAVDELSLLMSREIPQLGGLRVGCEVKAGPNWGDLRPVKVVRV